MYEHLPQNTLCEKSLEQINKLWIPCKEELPCEDGPVLCCDKYGDVEICNFVMGHYKSEKDFYDDAYFSDGTWVNDYFYIYTDEPRDIMYSIDEIVAWMPLPNKYKGE